MLIVDHVSFNYGKINAIKNISLKVKNGQTVCLIGGNGAGKTTLARLISGILHPAAGSIHFNDINISKIPGYKRVKFGITLVPEGRLLFIRQSVRVNLELGAYHRPRSELPKVHEDMEKVFSIFPRLRDRLEQNACTLSGGEQQMLAIGRALMARPKLLLLDEPSMGLSPILVQELSIALSQLSKYGLSILLVEQNAKLALNISEWGYVMESGKVVLTDSTNKLTENPIVQKIYVGECRQLEEKKRVKPIRRPPAWLRISRP